MPRDGCERIDRNIHRHGKVFVAGVNVSATEFIFVRKAYCVHDKIQSAPFFLNMIKQLRYI